MRDAILRAQSLFKKQKYRLAQEILESNVQLEELSQLPLSEQLTALDLLASLCEKQGSLNRARKYAVRMVRINERDARGYLRLGKLLQLIPDKLGEAIKIYQRALVKIDPLDLKCEAFLKRQLSLAMQKHRSGIGGGVSSQTLCDPVKRLPHDILVLIFQELTLRQRARCALVSKSWSQFLNSQYSFWVNLIFDATQSTSTTSKASVVTPRTVQCYCSRANSASSLQLDFQQVLVKEPKAVISSISQLLNGNSRLTHLKFDNVVPTPDPPTITMMRSLSLEFACLRELRINTASPQGDLRWCLENLPSLELLDLVTTARVSSNNLSKSYPQLKPVCSKLHTLSVMARIGSRVLSDLTIAEVSRLDSLQSLDLHRVAPYFWPCASGAFINPNLKRFGFTSGSPSMNTVESPLPKFEGSLNSLTLNDMSLSCILHPPILPDGNRYTGGSRTAMQNLRYVELKRVTIVEFNLVELLTSWGCASTLSTLVVHAFNTRSPSKFPAQHEFNFQEFPSLETLQFTNMGSMSDDCFQWIIDACPNLRKINLDGTTITGPKLVQLLQKMPKLCALRCKHACDVSTDTVEWIRNLPHVSVTF